MHGRNDGDYQPTKTQARSAAPHQGADQHEEPEYSSEVELGADHDPPSRRRSDGGDPVVREYDVFLNDQMAEKVMLLQYPNRDRRQPYLARNHAKPTELRMKSEAGLVEIDIPMAILDNYDQEKAVRFGDALKKSIDDGAGGALGLAGGFGVGGTAARQGTHARASRRAQGEGEPEITQDMLLADFERAGRLGHVLNKQTLGGQVESVRDGKPIYMVGVFRGDQLHLTPVDSIAQLRPQFHHLDAVVEQEKASFRTQRDMGNTTRQAEPRAVQMTAKSTDMDEVDNNKEIAKTLKAAQEEDWTRLQYADENSPDAWVAYSKLFVQDSDNVSKLCSSVTGADYLDAVSASSVLFNGQSSSDPPFNKVRRGSMTLRRGNSSPHASRRPNPSSKPT